MVFGLLDKHALLLEALEHSLTDFRLLARRRAPKLVEVYVEPTVDVSMDGMVMVTNLLGGFAFLNGLGFRRRSVLICPAHIHHVVPTRPHETRVAIRT